MKYVSCLMLLLSTIALADNRDKIAVIDTGAYPETNPAFCRSGHKDFSGTGIEDHYGHGMMVAASIARSIDPAKVCLLAIKWIDWNREDLTEKQKLARIVSSIEYAIASGAKFINMSLSGQSPNPAERIAISLALRAGIVIAVAAGNDNRDLSQSCDIYPACYGFKNKNFRVVANYDGFIKARNSNYGGPVNELENGGSGDTSRATAIFLGKYVRGVYENKCSNTCPAPKRLRH